MKKTQQLITTIISFIILTFLAGSACAHDVCYHLWAPVCGINGITYSNECYADLAGVEVAYEGECDNVCITIYDPVCGIDGTTYSNECFAHLAGVEVAYAGECNNVCIMIYDPVCGIDGKTYSNECIADLAGVEVAYAGECTCIENFNCNMSSYCFKEACADDSGSCVLRPEFCPDIWKPVCGCDGQTYGNECEANNTGMNIEHKGACEPECVFAAIASPNELWPPNHKMVSVSVSITENDNCDPDFNQTCSITSVTSNEPLNGTGDGNTDVDYEITGTHTVDLRAERAGPGSGRIYTITVECDDDAGNTEIDTVEVKVAHSKEDDIVLEDYDLCIWDFSGTDYNGVTLIQDAKGKVTGSGTLDYSSGETNLSIPVEIKGKVKGKNNIVSLKYKVKGKDADGNKLKDKVSLELDECILPLTGTMKRKLCAKGSGCETDTSHVSLELPGGMTGKAVLSIDVEPDKNGKKLEGSAELTFSNGEKYPLSAKGKYNSKKGETKFTLKGVDASTKAIKLKLKIDEESDSAMFIRGKAHNQNLKYK